MNIQQFWSRYRLLILVAVLSILVVSCGTRIGTSWGVTDIVTVYDQESILVAYNNTIAVVDPVNGQPVRLLDSDGEVRRDSEGNARTWIVDGTQYEQSQFYSRPLRPDEETLLFPAYNRRFLSVDLVSPTIADLSVADALPGLAVADIVEDGSTYYVPLQDGNLVALDAEDYSVKWTLETEEGIWSAPLLVDGTLYFGSLDHMLYAVNAENGQMLWTVDLGGGVASTPRYVDGHLYVGSFIHKVYDVSLEGEILAEHDTNNWVWSTPTLVDNILYVTDLSGFVYALDVNNGLEEVWSNQVSDRGIRPAPIVTDEHVVVASRNGKVYWLHRSDGQLFLEKEIDGTPEILSDMLLIEPSETLNIRTPLIVVSTTDFGKLLVAFEAEDGRDAWVYSR